MTTRKFAWTCLASLVAAALAAPLAAADHDRDPRAPPGFIAECGIDHRTGAVTAWCRVAGVRGAADVDACSPHLICEQHPILECHVGVTYGVSEPAWWCSRGILA